MTPKDFFDTYSGVAMKMQNLFGVPASISLAQGAIESGWGASGLTVRSNNFFGIKAGSSWKGETDSTASAEFINGVWSNPVSAFRKYKSPGDSFLDHALLLKNNSRYANLFNNLDPIEWAKELSQDGYANAPSYTTSITNLVNQYDLKQYDTLAPKKKMAKILFICTITTGLAFGLSYYKKWLTSNRNIAFTVLSGIGLGIVLSAGIDYYERNKLN